MNPAATRILPFFLSVVLAATVSIRAGEVVDPHDSVVDRPWVDPFYGKILTVRGFPILASGKVSDRALREAAWVIDHMIGHRPEVLDAITGAGVRLAVMAPDEWTTDIPEHSDLEPRAYWDKRARGLGATAERPAVSVGEENLLGLHGDPYATESILVHEFAHVIHQMGMNRIDPGFQGRLENAFARARLEELWKGKYAGTNPAEYWAEGVQSWFDTNREEDSDHNHVDTREELVAHDPGLAELVESVFGDRPWRYARPGTRLDLPHLAGFDRDEAPRFAWPEAMVKAYEALEKGEDLELAALLPMADLERESTPPETGKSISLRFENRSNSTVTTYWIGFDGLRRKYATIDPSRKSEQRTYGGHLWVVADESGRDIGWLAAPETDSRCIIP